MTNMDLLEKLSRKMKSAKPSHRPNRRVLSKFISMRLKRIDSRETFSHRETGTVVGNKVNSDVFLLTLAERKTDFELILKLGGKDAQLVNQAVCELRKRASENFAHLFKTITSDNGLEFPGLNEALPDTGNVSFSHPHTLWERGTSERTSIN